MSQFLPEGMGQSQPPSGVADITPADPETTSADIALMQRVLSAAARSPNLIPQDFMAYVLDWIQTQRLQIPIGQVFGFAQFTAQPATTITASGSTGSTTYTTTFGTTPGPSLAGLDDGQYALFFGCRLGGNTAYMNLKLNGTFPADDSGCASASLSAGSVSVARLQLATLRAGNGGNTVDAVYRTDNGAVGATGDLRWLVALKYANS